MKISNVTDAMLRRALARTKPAPAEIVRQQCGQNHDPDQHSEFVRYRQTTVVFKKVVVAGERNLGAEPEPGLILAFAVPKGALVHRGSPGWSRSRKCRTQAVYVLGRVAIRSGRLIQTRQTYRGTYFSAKQKDKAASGYRCGEVFTADGFFSRAYQECTPGVHFFETLKEARDW